MAKIEVILGDITEQDVDAIVNAAHEALMGGGGVDGAIHRKAGPALMQECMAIPEQEPGIRCRYGEAYLTSACRLPAKYIIHTVAPRFYGSIIMGGFQGDPSKKFIYDEGLGEELANCYRNSLKIAAKYGLGSIAFCSLGTGGHAFPIELACPIAIKTVLDNVDSTSLELVRFMTFSKPDNEIYLKTLESLQKMAE